MSHLLIDSIALPQDLRTLETEQLEQVAKELRNELIDSISSSGGHFASSLGATELSVALHSVFDTPRDKIIWDVGHQAYIHKMLTGRRQEMHTIRQKDGLSGYLKRSESEYDCFGAGHAGTSISAAVGMAAALKKNDPEKYVVAVIGDGALTSGMAFEALNHAGELELSNLIVVLNDNEMSISPNVGALSWLFSRSVTSELSTKARSAFKILHDKGIIPDTVYSALDRAEEATQGFFSTPGWLFGTFGFRYMGPIDGHHMPSVLHALRNAKEQDVPVLVHASTVKGKGYTLAESDPLTWHAVKPFDKNCGNFKKPAKPAAPLPPTYSSVFSKALIKIRSENDSVVGITAAMPSGTKLDAFQAEYPDSFFDVGISEQHAVTFAAGLACEGFTPVCAIYSTFLQRGFDQILHDVCIQKLPVVFALDRAGVVGNDGETHQGLFDVSYLRCMPDMVIMAPKDENELQHMLYTAVRSGLPIALRYPRGNGVGVALDQSLHNLEIGKAEILSEGKDVALIAFGTCVQDALALRDRLHNEFGVSVTVVNARFAKPLDELCLKKVLESHSLSCTIEDHALAGGFGSAVAELIQDKGIAMQNTLIRFGASDYHTPHATQAEQKAMHGYDVASMFESLVPHVQRRSLSAVGM